MGFVFLEIDTELFRDIKQRHDGFVQSSDIEFEKFM